LYKSTEIDKICRNALDYGTQRTIKFPTTISGSRMSTNCILATWDKHDKTLNWRGSQALVHPSTCGYESKRQTFWTQT